MRPLLAALLLGPAGLAFAQPGDTQTLIRQMRASIDAGQFNAAIEAGERAVAADPMSSEAHDLLGRAYGLKAQDSQLLEQARLAKKARKFFARAVELDPTNAHALADLATYDMRAPGILGGGKAKARREAEAVVALDPSRGYVLLGELAEREKNPAAAEAEYRKAIEASPRELRGRRALSTFFLDRKQYANARSVWIEARELDPSDPTPDFELAGIALASGDGLAPAVGELQSALIRAERPDAPSRAEIRARLAAVYENLGRKQEAVAEYRAALELEPGRADWRKRLRKLEK